MRKPFSRRPTPAASCRQWSQALQRLAMIVSDPDMHNAIGDPKVGPEQLYGLVAAGAGDALNAEAQNFVRVLIENDRLAVLPEIATLFEALKNEREGVIEAQIESAFPVDDAALAQLVGDLERRFKRKVRPQVHGRSRADRRSADHRRR